MKAGKIIAKVVIGLAAAAGVVYVVATYGNQIVAWCKKVLASLPCCKEEVSCAAEEPAEDIAEEPVEETPAEEVTEEAPAEAAAEEAVVAEDTDFEA